jgi:hypothetical protein
VLSGDEKSQIQALDRTQVLIQANASSIRLRARWLAR